MNFYIIHPESESAMVVKADSELDLYNFLADPCAELVEEEQFRRFCIKYKCQPEFYFMSKEQKKK